MPSLCYNDLKSLVAAKKIVVLHAASQSNPDPEPCILTPPDSFDRLAPPIPVLRRLVNLGPDHLEAAFDESCAVEPVYVVPVPIFECGKTFAWAWCDEEGEYTTPAVLNTLANDLFPEYGNFVGTVVII